MKESTTAQRLRQIMEIRNYRQVDVLRAAEPFCKKYGIRLGKNDMSQYLSGKAEPGQAKLTILGLALNVSEAWLMGYEVPMERNITPIVEKNDERIVKLVELFSLLEEDQQNLILQVIKGLLTEK